MPFKKLSRKKELGLCFIMVPYLMVGLWTVINCLLLILLVFGSNYMSGRLAAQASHGEVAGLTMEITSSMAKAVAQFSGFFFGAGFALAEKLALIFIPIGLTLFTIFPEAHKKSLSKK